MTSPEGRSTDDFHSDNSDIKDRGREPEMSEDLKKHIDKLNSSKPELVIAADTLLSHYPMYHQDKDVKALFDFLAEVFTQRASPQALLPHGPPPQFDLRQEPLLQPDADAGNKSRSWGWLNPFSSSGSSKTSSHAVKVHTVKVHTVTKGETYGADKVLMSQVKNCAQLQVKATDQKGCDIIILFCPIVSRPGSDVEVAMSMLSGNKPVIVVLMHHTWKVDYSLPEVTWADRFPDVILNVHVLFHDTVPGLLQSPRNQQAVRQIQTKLLQQK